MRAIRAFVMGWAALALAAGCGGSSSDGPTFQALAQGTWTTCKVTGTGTSEGAALTISDLALDLVLTDYGNQTCAGTGTPGAHKTGSLVIGAAVPATLEGAAVTATEIDLTVAGVTDYTIAYVNAAATPHRMYMGDHSGSNDGSTPALRTPTLDESGYFSKQ